MAALDELRQISRKLKFQTDSRRFGNSEAPICPDKGVLHPEGDRKIGPFPEKGALFFVQENRHGRAGHRIDAGLPQDTAGIAAAIQEEEGADAVRVALTVRAVADEDQAEREEGGNGRLGG